MESLPVDSTGLWDRNWIISTSDKRSNISNLMEAFLATRFYIPKNVSKWIHWEIRAEKRTFRKMTLICSIMLLSAFILVLYGPSNLKEVLRTTRTRSVCIALRISSACPNLWIESLILSWIHHDTRTVYPEQTKSKKRKAWHQQAHFFEDIYIPLCTSFVPHHALMMHQISGLHSTWELLWRHIETLLNAFSIWCGHNQLVWPPKTHESFQNESFTAIKATGSAPRKPERKPKAISQLELIRREIGLPNSRGYLRIRLLLRSTIEDIFCRQVFI